MNGRARLSERNSFWVKNILKKDENIIQAEKGTNVAGTSRDEGTLTMSKILNRNTEKAYIA